MQSLSKSLMFGSLAVSACLVANAETIKIEGTAAIVAGSINPPDPIEGCSKAKRDAEDKAVKAGTKGLESWDKLSTDSDCSLSAPGARGAGYVFIFKALGNFNK